MNDQDYDYFKSMNEQTIATSNAVLRSLMLINGGAAVAVLAFVGSLAGNDALDTPRRVADLTTPLVWFGWGVAVSVLSMILAYFTHYFTAAYAQADATAHKVLGLLKTVFHFFGLLAAFGSLGLFLVGMYAIRASVLTALN